ncbi:hypothetical protein GCM10010832_26470 [Psychroflexus planctonicus]|uniref:Fibrobacter succinogenes major paralogous domain-containing protein n=2 Tax=Psychroflexus planctonicus TaxID=1526575 RepID=A0ABQ1SN98_9FLAO|nr:hypothetical protein GCM10010832_26470 [Psychroflexus planctonicus]
MALFSINNIYAQVGIGTETPHDSAILEVQSTQKGFLPPRLTIAERDGIVSPANGLTIYNTDNKCLELFNNADWISICDGSVVTTPPYSSSYVHCSTPTEIVDVVSTTGKIWMDRNLGAAQVATSTTDSQSLGDLFQWGRFADGHQCSGSATYNTDLADTAVPDAGNTWDGKFVLNSANEFPRDWLDPQDNALWQGVNGENNPCPSGYRIPTKLELEDELNEFSADFSADATGAFQSPLKLPISGYRRLNNGYVVTTVGRYWVSTVGSGVQIDALYFMDTASSAVMTGTNRAEGAAIRCIKN